MGDTGGGFAAGLLTGGLGYMAAAPFFFASRIAHIEGKDKLSLGLGTLRDLYGKVGLGGLWRGSGVLVARGAVMSGTQLASYGVAKRWMIENGVAKDGPLLHCGASLVASVSLTTAICPLDVTLTRFQANVARNEAYSGSPLACARDMLHREGPWSFFRGWSTIWIRFMPSSVLTFLIYEQLLQRLSGAGF